MYDEWSELADLLANLIEKYATVVLIDDLSESDNIKTELIDKCNSDEPLNKNDK